MFKFFLLQLLWSNVNAPNRANYDGSIDMREIKEIRAGKNSKEFDKWTEETRRMDTKACFIVFYGSEFKLKSFAVVAHSEKECDLWLQGLRYMVADSINSPYLLQVERWLRKEFYALENSKDTVTLKEIKTFLSKVNCKISTSKLNELFQEIDTRHRSEINFDDFAKLYQIIMLPPTVLHECFDELVRKYSKNGKTVTLKEFQKFLIDEQNDTMAKSPQLVATFIKDFIQDVQRDVAEPYLTVQEFIDYLYSGQNQMWDKSFSKVYQDMTRPLSHYYIASSHNTYLTGDQFSSESSTEAYVRALRMGCRCIELDCWDGPDNLPLIFHGHTFTTKIKFRDVIQTIKDHAFSTSEYPVILSIEQNCSLPQQRKMAQAMQDVFGDMLLTQQIEKNETQLPSPFQLRRRIILKHKKLPDGCRVNAIDEATGAIDRSTLVRQEDAELDIRNTIKNGIMYLEDHVDKVWNPHFFVLTHQKLFYTEQHRNELEDVREDEPETEPPKETVAHEELHFGENWFHGKLSGGREEAERLLRQYAHLGDGTFLVRESVTFVGDYCLSFIRQGKPNHCRIKLKHENGTTKYYLIENVMFDSLYSLIMYYRKNILRSSVSEVTSS